MPLEWFKSYPSNTRIMQFTILRLAIGKNYVWIMKWKTFLLVEILRLKSLHFLLTTLPLNYTSHLTTLPLNHGVPEGSTLPNSIKDAMLPKAFMKLVQKRVYSERVLWETPVNAFYMRKYMLDIHLVQTLIFMFLWKCFGLLSMKQ